MSTAPLDSDDGLPPPDVDTTLLESLFYNEMMMLDDSSELLSTVTGINGDANAAPPPPPVFTSSKQATKVAAPSSTAPSASASSGKEDESLTYAEQSLLRDFGVDDSPLPHLSGVSKEKAAAKPGNQQHPTSAPASQHASKEAATYPPQQQHQNQDPNRYPPQQQHYHQQAYQYPHHYPSNGHHPAPAPQHHAYHQTSSTHQAPIQPRPPSLSQEQQRVSKGIKHSVTARQTSSSSQQSAPATTHPAASIPNPLANQHQSQPPPAHSHPHPSHPTPPPPPQHYHPHPHHQAHPHHPPQQHAYHYQPPHPGAPHPGAPHPGAHTPSLVPVPAPAPGHHPPAYGHHHPPPHGTAPPPYGSPTAPPHGTVASSAPGHHHPPPAPHPHSHPHTPAAHAHPHHPHVYPHTQPPKEQLVSQFATLANRLGINLPSNLLSSLTKSASATTAGEAPSASTAHQPTGPMVPFVNSNHKQVPQGSYAQRGNSNGKAGENATAVEPATAESSSSPAVDELRKTAEEAIAAATRKRSNDEISAAPMKASSAGSDTGSKPSYAKRRKKPRMADCESRLAHLRKENETLKRHLDNVTNQTEKFQQDRIKAEITMKQMMENNDTPDEELNEVIREYSEAYSDYGKRRHEELTFHLEQLQKLANPTNFTKMGLWTIAKANDSKDSSKQNPLVGILQKELNITTPQVRKILEQRQKIRDLCSNLNATLALIHQLKELCEQKNTKFNDRMTKTRAILTPKQVVKLIMWIKDNSDVLGNICPGWTSEQIVKRKPAPATTSASVEEALNATKSKETTTPAEVSSAPAATATKDDAVASTPAPPAAEDGVASKPPTEDVKS